jgi:hypothetical protein
MPPPAGGGLRSAARGRSRCRGRQTDSMVRPGAQRGTSVPRGTSGRNEEPPEGREVEPAAAGQLRLAGRRGRSPPGSGADAAGRPEPTCLVSARRRRPGRRPRRPRPASAGPGTRRVPDARPPSLRRGGSRGSRRQRRSTARRAASWLADLRVRGPGAQRPRSASWHPIGRPGAVYPASARWTTKGRARVPPEGSAARPGLAGGLRSAGLDRHAAGVGEPAHAAEPNDLEATLRRGRQGGRTRGASPEGAVPAAAPANGLRPGSW